MITTPSKPDKKTTSLSTLSKTTELLLEGMSCASCAGRIEKALSALDDVLEAGVNFATKKALVRHLERVEVQTLIEAVESAGYQAHLVEGEPEPAAPADNSSLFDFLLAAVLTLPVFVLEMGSHMFPSFHHWLASNLGQEMNYGIQALLTTAVLFGPGRVFFRNGIPALARGGPNMNSLVALGSGAAYLYSLVATFFPGLLPSGAVQVYYEPAALIVALILLGRYFEERAKGKTGEAISHLLNLRPKTARRSSGDSFVEVPLTEVRTGDVLQVRPGDTVPVDGELLEGESFLDESMLTGEAVPVKKSPGSQVVGGTVNKTGAFTLRAEKVGSDTVLSRIVRMVEQAQNSKLPIQAVVDRVTLWFVPAVLVVAVVTFLMWLGFGPEPRLSHALVAAVSVLIIACPCAMGLATPTSIMVGTGKGAELGLLFRGGDALQSLRDAEVVAFDKTGTLTEGRPTLTDFEVAEGMDADVLLAQVASVEALSEHPIASAIVKAAEEKSLALSKVTDFKAHAGLGVSARVGDQEFQIGADRYVQQQGLETERFRTRFDELSGQGKSPLYVVVEGQVSALLAVADRVKTTTPGAIRELKKNGLRVVMVTGDNRATAQAIADTLELDEVVAEVMPEQKVKAIQDLQSRYGKVAFVGDGINDAPALATADVGIAVGTGTDVAIESADVVVMSGNLGGVVSAIALSKATLRNIKQNLFWAFAYNVVLIPVAAGVLYPFFGVLLTPALAAAAMAFSSVFVVTNALRLKRFSRTEETYS